MGGYRRGRSHGFTAKTGTASICPKCPHALAAPAKQIGPPTRRGTAHDNLSCRSNSVPRRGSEVRVAGTGATFGHELIELGLVLRHPQARQEIAEFPLLLFQALQGVLAILVKRAIAARP